MGSCGEFPFLIRTIQISIGLAYLTPMSKKLGLLYLKLFGWQLLGTRPTQPKYVLAIAPHTSNIDFFLGLAVRAAWQLPAKFMGKSQLFRPPFGWLFRWLGGYPVNRKENQNHVEAVVEIFQQHEVFAIGIAPEGTRKASSTFKSGYYYIAKAAGVPIIRVAFDYATHRVIFDEPFYPSDDPEKDLKEIRDWFKPFKGYHPEAGVN